MFFTYVNYYIKALFFYVINDCSKTIIFTGTECSHCYKQALMPGISNEHFSENICQNDLLHCI